MWPTYWCRRMYRWCLHGHTKNNPEIRNAILMIALFTFFSHIFHLIQQTAVPFFLLFFSDIQILLWSVWAGHPVSVNLDTLSSQCPVVVTSTCHQLASVAFWWVQSLNSIRRIFLWKFKTLTGSQEACLCFFYVPHWPPTHWKCLYMKEFMLSPAPE